MHCYLQDGVPDFIQAAEINDQYHISLHYTVKVTIAVTITLCLNSAITKSNVVYYKASWLAILVVFLVRQAQNKFRTDKTLYTQGNLPKLH